MKSVVCMSMSNGRPKTRGFTLIELLVVVAIMVVLAALLTPAIQGARARGHGAVCRSNLRQYYSSFLHYAGDHGGLFPGYVSPIEPECIEYGWVIWQTELVRGGYLAGWTNGNGMRGFVLRGMDCPANPNGYYPEPGSTPGNFTWKYGNPDYMYPYAMGHHESCNDTNLGTNQLKGLHHIVNPSRKGLLYESGQQYGWPAYAGNYAIFAWPIYFDPDNVYYSIADVHENRSNVLFFDGHLESFARGKIDWRFAAVTQP